MSNATLRVTPVRGATARSGSYTLFLKNGMEGVCKNAEFLGTFFFCKHFTRYFDQEVYDDWIFDRSYTLYLKNGMEGVSLTQSFLVRFSLANILQDF